MSQWVKRLWISKLMDPHYCILHFSLNLIIDLFYGVLSIPRCLHALFLSCFWILWHPNWCPSRFLPIMELYQFLIEWGALPLQTKRILIRYEGWKHFREGLIILLIHNAHILCDAERKGANLELYAWDGPMSTLVSIEGGPLLARLQVLNGLVMQTY